MAYIIKYETLEQVGPEDYRMKWVEKIINNNTTVGEIIDWFEQREKTGKTLPKFFPEMRLTRADE